METELKIPGPTKDQTLITTEDHMKISTFLHSKGLK